MSPELPPSDALPAEPLTDPEPPVVVTVTPQKAREILRASRADVLALIGCNAVVFASSVCIMVLELAASRLIAAHLGQSLYSWTSVIGVVLAGISAGNFLGGWLSDRFPPQRLLAWLFLAAGLLTLSVLVLNYWAAGTPPALWLPWPLWVMFVVGWIFFVPSMALGTISPVTASIALKRTQRTGITVGNIYAWGAMGSIAGTFLAGFVLIDLFGTRAIIVMAAGTLLVMSLLVAAGQWALRSGVFFGGLPLVLLVGLCTAATADKTAAAVVGARRAAGIDNGPETGKILRAWEEWGRKLGRNFHELGVTLHLRDDNPDQYIDDSSYSEVSVLPFRDAEKGEQYKVLVLDALHHSYYDPADPVRLYYDYEQVYAGITERACNTWDRRTAVRLRQLPVDRGFEGFLPERVQFDPRTRELSVQGGLGLKQLRDLMDIGPFGPFRAAVLQAWNDSRKKQGQSSSTPLAALPEGIHLPVEMAGRIRYESFSNALQCDEPLPLPDAFRLMALGEQQPYVEDVIGLFGRSRRVRALFLGGGGFIFPRWIEALFPDRPRIDVAEIDPAVLLAVEQELGLPKNPAEWLDLHEPTAEMRERLKTEFSLGVEDARRIDDAGNDGEKLEAVLRSVGGDRLLVTGLDTRNPEVRVLDKANLLERLLKTRVRTHIDDARKFVQDQVRANARRKKEGRPEVRYDFIYGDAFNHYSVPFHLTTKEFDEQIRELLDPRTGVYLANIIDEFPRVEYPPLRQEAGRGGARCTGELPKGLLPSEFQRDDQWRPAPPPFEKLQVRGKTAGEYELFYDDSMPEPERDRLMQLTVDNDYQTIPELLPFREAVQQLFLATHERRTVLGRLPAALEKGTISHLWMKAPKFSSLEVQVRGSLGYILGWRGVMTVAERDELLAIAPGDAEFARAVRGMFEESHVQSSGKFLGRYVNTVRDVFPCVYVFTSSRDGATSERDTFVIACSVRRLDFANLELAGGYWPNGPFAWSERDDQGIPRNFGQMDAVLDGSHGQFLTDDYAPVDNLLTPLFQKDRD